ncbi:MAG: hypothetical protein AB7G34_13120 [Hyphomicrobiales bacterium]
MKAWGAEDRSIFWRIAEIVGRAARDQPDEAYVAVGHLLLNRIGGDWVSPPAPEACDPRHGLLADAECELGIAAQSPGFCEQAAEFPGERDRDSLLHALSVLARICAGEIEDPTGGAARCHRHDETPRWAEGETPRALIGHWFFY